MKNLETYFHGAQPVTPGRGFQRAWRCRCPAHDDKAPSMSVRLTDDGFYTLKCFSGCSTDEILGAVGLNRNDLWPSKRGVREFIARPELIPKETISVEIIKALLCIREGDYQSAEKILENLSEQLV